MWLIIGVIVFILIGVWYVWFASKHKLPNKTTDVELGKYIKDLYSRDINDKVT